MKDRGLACEKTSLVFKFSLCVSRACLGKDPVLVQNGEEKTFYLYRRRNERPRAAPTPKKTVCFEFSLCLSRACLGKTIIFSIKSRKRCVFRTFAWFRLAVDNLFDVRWVRLLMCGGYQTHQQYA